MDSAVHRDDSLYAGGYSVMPSASYNAENMNLDQSNFPNYSKINETDQQFSVGNNSSPDGTWDGRLGPSIEFMSEEGVFQLTKDLRKFSEALASLKGVFMEERGVLEKSLRVVAHERLGSLLQVLKIVVDKYSELNSTNILSTAGILIKHVKEFNYEDFNADVAQEIFRPINNLAMSFSNSVSESLMGDTNISPNLTMTHSSSFDGLNSLTSQSRNSEVELTTNLSTSDVTTTEEPTAVLVNTENVDELLYNVDSGLEMAFDRAKILSKYLNDLIIYVKKKAQIEMEHSKNLLKLSQTTKPTLSEQSFLPFQSLYCTSLDHDREYASNCQFVYQNVLLQQKFIEPLQARKNEHDRLRKSLKESWFKEKKRSEEAVINMKKSKQTYQSRMMEYQKAKEAAIRAETDYTGQQPNQLQQGYRPTHSMSSSSSGAGTYGKMDKKKRQEGDSNMKAIQAEHNYKAYVNEANKRLHDLDKTKADYLYQLHQLIEQCDRTAKSVTIAYFQQQSKLFSPLPVQFQAMCEDAKRYEPGFQYCDYIRSLPLQQSHAHPEFEFEPCTLDGTGSQYLVPTGSSKTADNEELTHSTKSKEIRVCNKSHSDNESSSSRSLDDLSPTGIGDYTKPNELQGRRNSIDGSLSSEEILDYGNKNPALEPTPDTSPVALRYQLTKQAGKFAANVKGAFKVKKSQKSSLFGVDICTAAQNATDGIPYLVKSCIAEIDNRALSTKGLYRVNGVKNRVEKLCTQFDLAPERVDLSQQSPHDISGVLKYFLRQLPEPLMQFKLYATFLDIAKDCQSLTINERKRSGNLNLAPPDPDLMESYIKRLKTVVEKLPCENLHTLQYIISHLTRVHIHSSENMMNSSNLAIIFGPTLLRPILLDGNESLKNLIDMPYQSRIVEMLINHKDFIFGIHPQDTGNNFPFLGFPPPHNFSAMEKTEDVASSLDQLSLMGDEKKLHSKNIAREEEILLDFEADLPYNSASNATEDVDDAAVTTTRSEYLQGNVSYADSRESVSNCFSLIDLEPPQSPTDQLPQFEASTSCNEARNSSSLFVNKFNSSSSTTTELLGDMSNKFDNIPPAQVSSSMDRTEKLFLAPEKIISTKEDTPAVYVDNYLIANTSLPAVPERKFRKSRKFDDSLQNFSYSVKSNANSSLPRDAKVAAPPKSRKTSIIAVTSSLGKLQKSVGSDVLRHFSRDHKVNKTPGVTPVSPKQSSENPAYPSMLLRPQPSSNQTQNLISLNLKEPHEGGRDDASFC